MGKVIKNEKVAKRLGIRHIQVFILFLSMAVNFWMRMNMSSAIVLMTDVKSTSDQPVFDWSMIQKSTILSIFQIGYIIMNLVGSVLVTRFQNKMILLISVVGSSALSLATPALVTVGGFYVLIIVRILLGLLQGPLMAVFMGQMSRWIPPNERSRCGSLVLGGVNLGNLIAFGVSGWVGDNYGWPSIFYFSGCAGIAWSILWAVIAADNPKSCWLISEEEVVYIEEELKLTPEVNKHKKIPWRGLLSNKACWALLLTSLGHNWGNWTLLNEMPTYFNSILNLDSTSGGLITALPHGCLCLFNLFSSSISDMLIKRRILSVGACRKLCNSIDGKAPRLGIRHLQAFIMFLCMAVNYLMRVNLSSAIVLMTDTSRLSDEPVFDWTMVEKSTALSSLHIGYFIMNLIASVLVTRFQNKMLLLISVAGSSILTLLTPILVIAGGFYILVAIRILLGLLQGFMMAVIMGQLSRWIPPSERSRCGSLVLGGINFGNMVSFGISGWIGGDYGWPYIFYFSGTAGVIWSILWAVIAADNPKSCWLISEEEKAYIEEELILTSEIKKDKKIPWRRLFSNKACWALLLTTVGHHWGNWTLLNEMPSYFKSIINLESTANGLITALPHGCLWVFSFFSSYTSDMLIKKKILSVGACRKICNTIGQWGPAAALLILSYTTDQTMVFVIYTIGVTLIGFIYIGFNINHLDIVPSDAGFFMGITNGIATITSFAGTEFAGIIVTDPENKYQWRTVFGVSAGIFFVSNCIFVIFGSGEVQPIEVEKSNTESGSGTPTIPVGIVIDIKNQ